MSSYLLDTNVVSEITKTRPDPNVAAFVAANQDLWLSSIVVHELEFGLQLLPAGRRRDEKRAAHIEFVTIYQDRILPLERLAAERAAQFRARSLRAGLTVALGDTLIAGTASAYDLAVATRNVRDFGRFAVEVVNPWEYETA